MLAKRIGFQSSDEAYALGLFHNCGIPLMLQRFPNYFEVQEEAYFRASGDNRVVDTENRLLNTNHSVVGYFIAVPGGCRSESARRLPTITTPVRSLPTTPPGTPS